jgi:hypothetical protein
MGGADSMSEKRRERPVSTSRKRARTRLRRVKPEDIKIARFVGHWEIVLHDAEGHPVDAKPWPDPLVLYPGDRRTFQEIAKAAEAELASIVADRLNGQSASPMGETIAPTG